MADQQYDNTNRGALFVNEQKKSLNSPDFTGNINVNGVEYFLSMWKKVSRAGKSFLSLAVTPKGQPKDDGFGDLLSGFDQTEPSADPKGDYGALRDDLDFLNNV